MNPFPQSSSEPHIVQIFISKVPLMSFSFGVIQEEKQGKDRDIMPSNLEQPSSNLPCRLGRHNPENLMSADVQPLTGKLPVGGSSRHAEIKMF